MGFCDAVAKVPDITVIHADEREHWIKDQVEFTKCRLQFVLLFPRGIKEQ